MSKLLIIEDDKDLVKVVRDWLEFEKHVVEEVYNGSSAIEILRSQEFDLIVLDWWLPEPEIDGLAVLTDLRARKNKTPVLFLTGRTANEDKITGLDSGADDYITKPFDIKEFLARVRALLRRAAGQATNVLTAGNLSIDAKTKTATLSGSILKLTPAEYALLEFFLLHPNQAFTAETLLFRVWNTPADLSTDTVRSCIKRLRRKLSKQEEGGQEDLIETVGRSGYRLNALDQP